MRGSAAVLHVRALFTEGILELTHILRIGQGIRGGLISPRAVVGRNNGAALAQSFEPGPAAPVSLSLNDTPWLTVPCAYQQRSHKCL